MRRHLINLGLIALVTAIAAAAVFVQDINFIGFQRGSDGPLGMRMGLDIQGGTHLVYQTVDENPDPGQMEGLVQNISRRVDRFGVSEPIIQRMGERRLLIQLPGVTDIEEAKGLIGATAELDFREIGVGDPEPLRDSSGNPIVDEETGEYVMGPGALTFIVATGIVDGQVVELNGALLQANGAQVGSAQNTGGFQVTLSFNNTGGEVLEQVTLRNIDRPLGIFVDGLPISTPNVRSAILAGQPGIIDGLELEEARLLAIQLNAGALPVAIELVQEADINPTLGETALQKGVQAGLVGLALVLLFLIVYYRLAGFTAALALVIYTIFVLAAFKLVPVTLTLSGLAAFILSIGMAVDANVLIFERMKEEIKAGRSLRAAIDVGFNRAWPAIRDGNFSTIITCAILFWFAQRLGASFVMGFAVTLFFGVVISMLTAIIVTRTFLRSFTGTALSRRLNLFHA